MLNALANAKFDINDILSMIKGHKKFLDRNTGDTNNSETEHFVLNMKNIMSNNRHFTNKSMAEGQPNGDATTEGQSLLILGFIYAYMATGEQEYLDDAKKYFDAYTDYFYANKWDEDGTTGHNPIPSQPQSWVCNWIVNGKEPVDSDYPLDSEGEPTHGGFKGTVFTFPSNLIFSIPHGAPHWGEYLDKATFAFDGALAWDSIVATVYGTKKDADGNDQVDWSDAGRLAGKQYDVDWVVDLYGRKVNWPDGIIINANPTEPKGTVKLKDTWTDAHGVTHPTPAGDHKFNYAVKLPPAQGGYSLPRNKPWHNRPVNVPVGLDANKKYTNLNELGNSSDSEQWFGDVAYLLFQITQDQKYYNAWQAVMFNTNSYSDIDASDMFFRKSTSAKGPFTDGISYDYFYPSKDGSGAEIPDNSLISREAGTGYITVRPNVGIQRYTLEQQAVWFKVDANSVISTQVGGKTDSGKALMSTITLKTSKIKQANDADMVEWRHDVPTDLTGNVITQDVKLSDFVRTTKPDGSDYLLVDQRLLAPWGGGKTKASNIYSSNIIDGRSATVGRLEFPPLATSSDGAAVGLNWLMDDDPATGKPPLVDLKSLTYRSTKPIRINMTDESGWDFHSVLPNTNGVWVTVPFTLNWTADNYQSTKTHAAWYREIRNDKDLGASHESWYIPGDQPAHRMYYNGYYTGPAWREYTDKGYVLYGVNDWREPGWLDLANLHGVIRGYPSKWYEDPPERGKFPNGAEAWKAWYDKDYWAKRGDTNTDPDPTYFNSNYWDPDTPWIIKSHDGSIIYDDHTPPTNPVSTRISQVSLVPLDGNASDGAIIELYSFNDFPPRYNDTTPSYTMLYRLEASAEAAPEGQNPERFTFQVGDCYVKNYLKNNLAYTPGVIPFSNIYATNGGTSTFDGWHGMPYPGYQYPFIWMEFDKKDYELHLNNMVNFLWDSQQEYNRRYGQLGPGMSAYVWNRWDNYKYGTPDTFTEYHWGDDHAWSGYQPRAFAGACRAAYELMIQNKPIPQKLTEYCTNWIKWLHTFISDANVKFGRPLSPTEWYFPKSAKDVEGNPYYKADGISHPNPDDYTGHMNGLWLTGACYYALVDKDNAIDELPELIEWLAEEINYNYKVTDKPNQNGVPHAMAGSWTPATKEDTGFGKECQGLFYGFWAGEILRGLGMYLLYKQLNPGQNMYQYARG